MAKDRLEKLLSKVEPISDEQAAQDIAVLENLTKPFNAARDELIRKAITKPEQLSLLPSQLCRTTIFYPLPRRGRKKLQAEYLELIFKSEWGTIKYNGMRLSVADEDLLLVCLYLAEKNNAKQFLTTFTELQGLLNIAPNQKYNRRFKEAFQRLGAASFFIDYKNENDMWSVNHILKTRAYRGKLRVTFDEDFYEEFLNSYTIMSLPFRMKLKGDLAKLLFTFLSSHRTPVKYFSKTLCDALNMNMNQKKKYLIQSLKAAFEELKERGFLIDYSYKKTDDIFILQPIERKKWRSLK